MRLMEPVGGAQSSPATAVVPDHHHTRFHLPACRTASRSRSGGTPPE